MKDRVKVTLILALAVLAGLELLPFVHHHHDEYPWQHWPGAHAVIGVAACIVVVLLSKWIGHAWLQKPEERDE